MRGDSTRGRAPGLVVAAGVALVAAALGVQARGKAPQPAALQAPPASVANELVWPLPPDPPRVRFVAAYSGEADFKKKAGGFKRLLLGPEPPSAVALKKPYGVAASDDGRIYVTDTGSATVFAFDPARREVRQLGVEGRVHFRVPTGIAVDGAGRVFVADSGLAAIYCFDAAGKPVMSLGGKELQSPAGLAIDRARHRLYAADSRGHRILSWDIDSGRFVAAWGTRGGGDGQFNYPTNLAVDKAGRVYVTDTGNFRVAILDADGRFVRAFGDAGDAMGHFHRPKGIGVDSAGHVYVSDAAFNNYQIFDDTGQLLLWIGGTGRDPGTFWLPAGLYVDAKDRVYVVDQANARVQVFQYLGSSAK